MAASDLQLDLLRNSPANLIAAEIVNVDTAVDRSVWPENFPFYINDGELTVEGRKAGGGWVPAYESIDFAFSPIFVEYSIATGVEVASYIYLLGDKFDQVRFTYRALGKYIDNVLAAEIIGLSNKGSLDRSSVSSWTQVKGSAPNYSPLARDPNVIDRSAEEVIYNQAQLIIDALRNPNSGTAVLPKDITTLNLAIAERPTESRVLELMSKGQISQVTANANTNAQIHRVPIDTLSFTGTMQILTDTGRINLFQIECWRVSTSGAWQFHIPGNGNRDLVLFPTFSMATSGNEYVLIGKLTYKATYMLKEQARFAGV